MFDMSQYKPVELYKLYRQFAQFLAIFLTKIPKCVIKSDISVYIF